MRGGGDLRVSTSLLDLGALNLTNVIPRIGTANSWSVRFVNLIDVTPRAGVAISWILHFIWFTTLLRSDWGIYCPHFRLVRHLTFESATGSLFRIIKKAACHVAEKSIEGHFNWYAWNFCLYVPHAIKMYLPNTFIGKSNENHYDKLVRQCYRLIRQSLTLSRAFWV